MYLSSVLVETESNVFIKTGFCRYWLSAGSSDSLSVHVLLNGELGPALWSLSGATSDSWEVAEVTVSSPSKFRVSSIKDYIEKRFTPITNEWNNLQQGGICSAF